jgi:hypothetical protein
LSLPNTPPLTYRRIVRWTELCNIFIVLNTHGRGEISVQGFVGKARGKETTRKTKASTWENGIRMDLGEIGFGGVDWIRLAQDRDRWRAVVSEVMNLRVLKPRI